MDIHEMSDDGLLHALGKHIQTHRLNKNISQEQLARLTGTSRNSIQALETGKGVKLLTYVQVLRALDSLQALETLLSAPPPSPLQLAKLHGQARQRASGERGQTS